MKRSNFLRMNLPYGFRKEGELWVAFNRKYEDISEPMELNFDVECFYSNNGERYWLYNDNDDSLKGYKKRLNKLTDNFLLQ